MDANGSTAAPTAWGGETGGRQLSEEGVVSGLVVDEMPELCDLAGFVEDDPDGCGRPQRPIATLGLDMRNQGSMSLVGEDVHQLEDRQMAAHLDEASESKASAGRHPTQSPTCWLAMYQ